MAWVVVDDPLPAGAPRSAAAWAATRRIATQGERRQGTVWPAFEERTFTAYRAYFRYVPKGRFVVEYTVRLNNPGRVQLAGDARRSDVRAGDVRRDSRTPPWTVQP